MQRRWQRTNNISGPSCILANADKDRLLRMYGGKNPAQSLSYGTVPDYCDSCDSLPQLSALQGDLKDLQRPWMLKTILGLLRPGAELLEIGAGEPSTAAMLSELGYPVTVVDPYDGSGHGPTDYDRYVAQYPRGSIVREALSGQTTGLASRQFDCVYSISVLEHLREPAIAGLFEGINRHLKPGGVSVHAIDFVASGRETEFRAIQMARILELQAGLAHAPQPDLPAFTQTLLRDDETYYLSASGHNLWRGGRPYVEFPFRSIFQS